jgi:hypothetical protein
MPLPHSGDARPKSQSAISPLDVGTLLLAGRGAAHTALERIWGHSPEDMAAWQPFAGAQPILPSFLSLPPQPLPKGSDGPTPGFCDWARQPISGARQGRLLCRSASSVKLLDNYSAQEAHSRYSQTQSPTPELHSRSAASVASSSAICSPAQITRMLSMKRLPRAGTLSLPVLNSWPAIRMPLST